MPGDEGQSPESPDRDFSDALASLKRAGSNLLVTGAVPGEASAESCRRMLGDDGGTDRQRLFVFTDADSEGVADRLPDGHDCAHDGVTLIDHAESSRGAAATSPGGPTLAETPESPSSPSLADRAVAVDCEVDATDLVELGRTITETIDEIDDAAGGLEPAELRLCLDSLLPLLESNPGEAVFRFLHVLTSQVRRRRGMAHYHLPIEPTAEQAHLLAPLFDAVVELRTENGTTQQRWHVHEAEITTDWLVV